MPQPSGAPLAGDEVRRLYERYELVGLAINDAVWDYDVATGGVWRNVGFQKVLGYAPDEVGGDAAWWRERVHPEDRDRVVAHARDAVDRGERVFEAEYRFRRRDGSYALVQDRAYVLRDATGDALRVIGSMMDVTERKQIEEQLRRSQAKLRGLAAHQQEVREEERARIAREIHDVLGQALTALKLELAAVRERVARAEHGVDQKLVEMAARVDQMIKTVRRLSSDLRPPVLDELGLPAAVEWLAQDVARRSGIAYRVRADLDGALLPRRVATTLFRIAQEALTNVARHAGATHVDVTLRRPGNVLELEVADDGRGITETEVADAEALGILGMRERALLLGGVLEIVGRPGHGTRLKAWVPLR